MDQKKIDRINELAGKAKLGPLSEEELAALLKGSKGYYLFDVVKVEDTYNTTDRFLYLVGIDADEETSYWLQIAFDSSELCWDKYMNRIQNG